MSYPDELLKLKTDYEDLNLNNVQTLNAYNEAVGDFVKNPSEATYKNVKFVYDAYKDILDKCVVNASTLNDISDAILSLQKYTIEKKKQTVVAPATKVSNVEYPSLNGKVVEQETGDIWVVIQNSKIIGVREKTDNGYSTIYEYKAITPSDIGAVNKTGDSLTGQYTLSGVFLPASNNMYALGSSSKRWAEVYTKNIYADNIMSNDSACLTEANSIGKIAHSFTSHYPTSAADSATATTTDFTVEKNKAYLVSFVSNTSAADVSSLLFLRSTYSTSAQDYVAAIDLIIGNATIKNNCLISGMKVTFKNVTPSGYLTIFEIGGQIS